MKLHFIPAVLIVALVSAGVVPSNASLERLDSPLSDDISLDWSPEATVHTNTEPTQFEKAAEIGRTLDAAMKSKDSIARWFFKDFPNFSETCQSPFDGDGREELKKWGFEDSEALSKTIEKDCDFDKYHNIKAAFDELGLDTKAEKDGTFEFAVNPGGMVALMNVMSLSYCAERFTWFRKPRPDELPHIGTPSDIAWAVWNRAGAASIADVKYLVVTQIMNAASRELIRQALGTLQPPQSETKIWPGSDFTMDTTGGRAILGSPIGRWAGYFLLQHKEKLGGNRFISKVRAFKPVGATLPYLIFYVDPNPLGAGLTADVPRGLSALPHAPESPTRSDSMNEARVVRRSSDGRNVEREHAIYGDASVVRAKVSRAL
ncbi:uncharacterized protein SETTUDRAFT_153104 [Exserohilum turcica Et28A]|uniref:Uncharacterized protein n=1 Tax=Exserohilum turcicum (strain 28A) TaxID=671987 RepID=R0KH03_EXST2|nr:uncharacterized protein SETTUDRAFT_153104 [Exserohilum turcica Et28A]EOA92123.1 hypothetical protein SETTUDRAFT_153104 [Exserohilum turcica Et28A]